MKKHVNVLDVDIIGFLRVPGCSRGGGNWGTLRIPREDWGTLGNIRETPPLGPPRLNKPLKISTFLSPNFPSENVREANGMSYWSP